MLNNYQYFLALADEQSISKAADKLFISHQCLSKYLKNLEAEYKITFFDRAPKLTLTPAGQAYLDTVRQVQMLENNLAGYLDDLRQEDHGTLRFGTTEGRYRILVPHFLTEFKKKYPDVTLHMQSGTTDQLSNAVLDNALDIALLNQSITPHAQLDIQPVLEEKLYLVISDNMLKRYFDYPQCKQIFSQGVNLRLFADVPFVLSPKQMNMRRKLEEHLQSQQITLKVVSEIPQSDLQYMLTAKDYAASFCWSMYLPSALAESVDDSKSSLNVFPIEGDNITNRLMMVTRRGKLFPQYGKDFMKLVKRTCIEYAEASP